MKIKIRNILEIVLQIGITVLLFMPYAFEQCYHVGLTVAHSELLSFYESIHIHYPVDMNLNLTILGWIALILGIFAIIFCIIQLISNNKMRNFILIPILAFLEFALYLAYYYSRQKVTVTTLYEDYYYYKLYYLSYIQIALYISFLVLSCVSYFIFRKNRIVEENSLLIVILYFFPLHVISFSVKISAIFQSSFVINPKAAFSLLQIVLV